MERCDACRFVYDDLELDDVPAMLRSYPARYTAALRMAVDRGLERRRPRPETWSALEYACHVRDMLQVQLGRLELALHEERPVFTPMGRDERAVRERYNEQDVTTVLTDLDDAANTLASVFEGFDDPQWRRTGVYSWPETADRSLAWVARHTVHEAMHHLDDITRGLEQLETQGRVEDHESAR